MKGFISTFEWVTCKQPPTVLWVYQFMDTKKAAEVAFSYNLKPFVISHTQLGLYWSSARQITRLQLR